MKGLISKSRYLLRVHEAGHALYDLQCDRHCPLLLLRADLRLRSMNLSEVLGEHCRQKPAFCSFDSSPLIRKQVNFANHATDDELYLYFNNVKADYIRVDADEVTYNLHIALRYEIEKKIFGSGSTSLRFPEFWNDRMEHLLGVRPTRITGSTSRYTLEQWPLWLFPNLHFGKLDFSYYCF